MNRTYRTVWNAALGASVAVAENKSAPRATARGSRRSIGASAALALATIAASGVSNAELFTAANEAELINAINLANASKDASSTITYTGAGAFAISGQLPQVHSNVTIDAVSRTTAIGSVAGASLDIQAGATNQGAAIQVGAAAGSGGSVVAQGSGATLSGTTLTTAAGQSTVSILDGASATFTGNLSTGAGVASVNVGNGASLSTANLSSGTGLTTITVAGGTISLGTNANLGGGNGAANGGITNVVVTGTGASLRSIGAGGYYHHSGTLEVSDGGFVGANTVQVGFRAGDVFTATVTGAKSVFGSINNNLSVGGAGTATITVADGATLTSGTNGINGLALASSATGVATLNIGAPVGSAPAAPGFVTASSITSSRGKSTVNFNHNASGYQFSVPITGTAAVNQVGSGTTVLTGSNTYLGGTNIAAGALQLGNGGATGSILGNVTNDATLAVNRNNAYTFAGVISGGGAVQQLGTGTTTLTGTNTYTGGTTVQAGRLLAGSAGAFVQNTAYSVDGGTLDLGNWDLTTSSLSGTGGTVALNAQTLTADQAGDSSFAGAIVGTGGLVKTGAGALTLSGNNIYAGATNVAAGTLRAGAANSFSAASAYTVASGATLDAAGFNQTLSSLSNAGTVSLPGSTPGNTLTITGPCGGNGGTLPLGTALGDSTSASDRLVLSGASASASGKTQIQVTNLGGLGALTTGNGIEVVSATGGATTTAQTTKDAFSLAGGHVDAGAYEYRLHAADASGAGENWYLRSTAAAVVPDPAIPAVPAVPGPAEEPDSAPAPVPLYRAEVPLYAVVPEQFREFDFAMLGNLHQRVGDERAASSSGTAWGNRQGWGRIISMDRDIAQQGTVNPSSNGRLNGFQAGTDLWANPNWRTGLYAGQLEGDMDVNGFARGVVNYAAGRNDLRSQYLGAYATWSQPGGTYVDGVLQAGRHRYTAYPAQGQASSGKGDSLVASIEVGQGFAIAPRWVLEPQLQLAYQHLSLDDTAISGATIQQDVDGGWIARAGVRVKGAFDAGPGMLQPYARANLYKRSSGTDVTRFIGPAASTDIVSRTGGTSSELALGATWQLGQATSLYGELGKLWDLSGDARTSSGVSGSVGVKVLW